MGIETAIIGSALIGGVASHKAAKKQASAADNAAALQADQYAQAREDQAPWREAGAGALDRLNRASTGDMSDFYKDPSYEFVRGEGTRDVGNSFAAAGGSMSGNAMKELTRFNQGLAETQYGNWWNRQAGIAGAGQGAVNATQNAGSNYAANAGNSMMAAGNARASGVAGIANSVNAGIGNYLYYTGLNKPKNGLPTLKNTNVNGP